MARAKSGTKEGDIASARWRETMTQKYGDISKRMSEVGRLGGSKKVAKGFAMNRDLAKAAGALGGRNSRKAK
jgi:general stress protein YciG